MHEDFPVKSYLSFITKMLITDFMAYFHLKIGIIFFCGENYPTLIQEYFISYVPIKTFNLSESKNLLHFDHRSFAVIFDIKCERTEKIFKVFSRNNFFNRSYNWLMFDDNLEHSHEMLSEQNINIDAEITLAVFENDSSSAKLYDVYNPSFKRGGKLNVTDKGIWSEDIGLNITLTQSKIERRSNLNGIVLHAVVVATAIPPNHTLVEHMESNNNMELDSQHVTF